jgi:hypothetical protein
MGPFTPAAAWWMWAATAGRTIPWTSISTHTRRAPGATATVEMPVPSRSPAPGWPSGPISERPDSEVARSSPSVDTRWSWPRTAPLGNDVVWTLT